jgi:hypothetical protein
VELTRPLSVAAPAQMDVHGIAGRSDKDTDMVGCLVPTDSILLRRSRRCRDSERSIGTLAGAQRPAQRVVLLRVADS